MLKIVGSILIISASVGIAYSMRMEMEEHLRLLYELRKLFVNISYAAFETRQPVEILLGCFVQTRDERLNALCREMAERLIEKKDGAGEDIWRSTFMTYNEQLRLSRDEMEVIESAGSAFFGKSIEENKGHLTIALERLDFLIEAARSERKEKQKVYGTLSVMCGLMIVILLV